MGPHQKHFILVAIPPLPEAVHGKPKMGLRPQNMTRGVHFLGEKREALP